MELALLSLMLLLPFLLAAPTVSAEPASPGKPRSTCQSPECVKLAAGMAAMMNPAVDPCEDFYSYACGNFPNTVLFDPRKVTEDEKTSLLLPEDIVGLLQARYWKKIENLLQMQTNVTDSDHDIQDVYNLTSLFFHSCSEWLRKSDQYSLAIIGHRLSAGFFNAMYRELMLSIRMELEKDGESEAKDRANHSFDSNESGCRDDSINMKAQNRHLEVILAAMVRSGEGSLISVKLPRGFASNAVRKGLNLTDVVRATVHLFDRRWDREAAKPFVNFFMKHRIACDLDLDDVSSSFQEVIFGLEQEESGRMSHARRCGIKSGWTVHVYTVAQLDQLSKCVNKQNPFSWKLFFEKLLQSSIDTNELIEVNNPSKLITVTNFYKRQPVYSGTCGTKFSTHVIYLIFDRLLSFGDFLKGYLRQAWHRQALWNYGDSHLLLQDGWRRMLTCQRWTLHFMQPVLDHMYRVAYHPKGFSKVLELIQLLKEASIRSVQGQDWIEDRTKEVIVDKIRHMSHSITLYDLTNQQIKDYYSEALHSFRALTISMTHLEKSFGSLMSIVLRADAHMNFYIMSGSSALSTLFRSKKPLVASVFNIINDQDSPFAVLEPPAYHHSYPDFINLGSIGYIIGHEMGHSFDNDGYMLNRHGKQYLWGERSEKGYVNRTECVRSCYGNYRLYKDGPQYNSNKTLAEDISDILGLKAAFDALQILKQSQGNMPWLPNLHTELNQDQLFFVQVAQSWCINMDRDTLRSMPAYTSFSPNHLRVRGMMQNSWDFARTFKCRPGQPMNPRRKCTFW